MSPLDVGVSSRWVLLDGEGKFVGLDPDAEMTLYNGQHRLTAARYYWDFMKISPDKRIWTVNVFKEGMFLRCVNLLTI